MDIQKLSDAELISETRATARERIRVMHLSNKVPEVMIKLEFGELSLSTAAQVSSSFCYSGKLSTPEVAQVIQEASRKSMNEVERLSKTDIPIPKEKIRQVTAELQVAKVVLDEETQSLLQKYEELHGKKKFSEILKSLLSEPIQKSAAKEKPTLSSTTTQSPSPKAGHHGRAPLLYCLQAGSVSAVRHSPKPGFTTKRAIGIFSSVSFTKTQRTKKNRSNLAHELSVQKTDLRKNARTFLTVVPSLIPALSEILTRHFSDVETSSIRKDPRKHALYRQPRIAPHLRTFARKPEALLLPYD